MNSIHNLVRIRQSEECRYCHPCLFFYKLGQSRPLFCLFSVFSDKPYHLNNKSIWKMSCPSSIWCWDSNSRPLKHELSPITTRPRLPPNHPCFFYGMLLLSFNHLWPGHQTYSFSLFKYDQASVLLPNPFLQPSKECKDASVIWVQNKKQLTEHFTQF